MKPLPIEGHTRRMTAPANWDSSVQGNCGELEIIDADGIMFSAWKPTEAELKRLNEGAPVVLGIMGTTHPVVSLSVSADA